MRFDQLAEMTDGTLAGENVSGHSFTGVSIDSRTIRKGELFVAIRGNRVDGHDYLAKALDRGAAGLMVEDKSRFAQNLSLDTAVVSVPNSHQAMLSLAAQWRNHCSAKIIGITGSNGKTTTKELTFGMLNAVEKGVYRSPGNFNNLYGAPLSIFGIDEATRVAVLELGISTKDEMPRLAKLVHPDLVLITNVGPSHLEFFGTVEAVAQAKLELARQASPDVPVIINADDALLVREAKKLNRPLVTFGINAPADFVPERISPLSSGGSEVTIRGRKFRVPLIGMHHVSNVMAAYAAAVTLGYGFESTETSAIEFSTVPMRGQLVEKNGIRFFNDAYNANPESVKASLEAFAQIRTRGRRIIILGDMLELGESAAALHAQIGKVLAAYQFDQAFLVGKLAGSIAAQAVASGVAENKVWHSPSRIGAVEAIVRRLRKGDLVMVKASRGVGLEAVIDRVEKGEVT